MGLYFLFDSNKHSNGECKRIVQEHACIIFKKAAMRPQADSKAMNARNFISLLKLAAIQTRFFFKIFKKHG